MLGALSDPRNAGVLAVMRARSFAPALSGFAGGPNTDTLQLNEQIALGESLVDTSARFKLKLEGDGNLVLYDLAKGKVLWQSSTGGKGVVRAYQCADGPFALLNAKVQRVWAVGSSGGGGHHLTLQADGNLVLYNAAGKALWATNTWQADIAQAATAASLAANAGKLGPGLDKMAYIGKKLSDLTPEAVAYLREQAGRVHNLSDPYTNKYLGLKGFGTWWIAAAGPDTTWHLSKDTNTRLGSLANILKRYDNPATTIVQVHVDIESGSSIFGTIVAAALTPITAPTTLVIDGASNLVSQIPGVNINTSLTTDAFKWEQSHPVEAIAITAGAAAAAVGGAAVIGAVGTTAVVGAGTAAAGAVGKAAVSTGANILVKEAMGSNGPPPSLTPQAQVQAQQPPAPQPQQADLLDTLKKQVLLPDGRVNWKSPAVIGGLVVSGLLLYLLITPPPRRQGAPIQMVMPWR